MAKNPATGSYKKAAESPEIENKTYPYQFFIESFGVRIAISTNDRDALEALKSTVRVYLADCLQEIDPVAAEHRVVFLRNENHFDALYKNGEQIFNREHCEANYGLVASHVRLTVAEYAVGRVFIHAGVVALKNKAVIIPGKSFRGKSALTAALVKRGALYYSDEFAILDADGLVHPFPKMLSLRGEIDEYRQVDHRVESLGGTAGSEKIEVGMVLITEYKKNARWNPKAISAAQGLIELISNSVSIRQNPRFTLAVLNHAARAAKFVKSKRGDLSKSADEILRFLDAHL